MRRLAALLALALLAAGCGERDRLAGTWQPAGTHPADTLATRYTFFADARARIVTRPPLGAAEVYEARYTVAGDTLLTLADDQGEERFRMRLEGDTLWLQSPATGRATHLVRVRGT